MVEVKAITNAFFIDGTGKAPQKDATILIEDKRIAAVGKNVDVPKTAKTIDADGKTVMPGLMDLHIHLGGDSVEPPRRRLYFTVTTPPALKVLHAANNARKCIEAGFTTVRNMGLDQDLCWDPSLREAIELGIIPGPRILASAGCVRKSGQYPYGNYVGMPEPYQKVWNPADGPYECRRAVREAVALGADFIKFFGTGSVGAAGEKHTWVLYTMEEMKAITDEAHRHERTTACHCHGTQGIKDAVIAGTDTVEHGTYMDKECVKLMLKNGTYYVPTLTIVENLVHNKERDVPEHMLNKAKETWEHHVPSAKMAYKAGMKITCGTDYRAGINAQELDLFVKIVGMSPMEAIVAATKTSAEAIHRENELGTLEQGKLADVLIVDGNPLQDITVLQDLSKIKMVMKDGKVAVNRGL